MGVWLVVGLGQEIHEMRFSPLAVAENKQCSKKGKGMPTEQRPMVKVGKVSKLRKIYKRKS